jgi:FHA domain
MDSAGHYRSLIALGRAEFLAAAAPAALVRHRGGDELDDDGSTTLTIEADVDETVPMLKEDPAPAAQLEVYPLVKKPGASFPDRITIGRTPNNDVVINEHSVSRLHAYVRKDPKGWVVADAGSKNGSWLRGKALEARQERALTSNAQLRFGEVTLTFYLAAELFDALGGEG